MSCGCRVEHGPQTVYRTASEAMACPRFVASQRLAYIVRLISEVCRGVTLEPRKGLRDWEEIRYARSSAQRSIDLIQEAC